MSDSTMPHEGNTDVSGENTDGFKPVTSQEDLDRIIENRLVRERKKFADPVSHSHFKKCEKPRHFNEKPRNFNSSGATQWRWGESNPRPTAGPEVFSGRILLLISQLVTSCRPAVSEAQSMKCRSTPTDMARTQWPPE